jgi:hypothetical protein
MRPKILIAAGLVLAFISGVTASGIYSATSRAFNPAPDEKSIALEQTAKTLPAVSRTQFVQPRTVYVSNPAPTSTRTAQVKKQRSLKQEALIVGGGAGAGAAIGAVAGGGKGAAVGALSGGVAGLVYDLLTRHK